MSHIYSTYIGVVSGKTALSSKAWGDSPYTKH